MRLELFVRWMPSSVALVLGMAACAPAPDTLSLAGRWDATIVVNDLEIPFAFEIADDGQTVQGTFFNGELRITSTGGRFDDDTLSLAFDQYATSIEASYANGQLEGRYERGARRSYPFHARPATPIEAASAEAPSIAGVWIIPTESSKGERAWRFIAPDTSPPT